ncbi:MAG: UxaA family hydrolase [Candidatus Latescibacteria bacterium]|nr:UxaA family hydrolase [Candidatus Latescibacterota bacterium]
MKDMFLTKGWLRSDGQKGIRNHVAVVFTVECAEHVARKIAEPYTAGHNHVQLLGFDGCHSNEFVKRVFGALVINPNVYGVVVVSLGCETLRGEHIVEAAQAAGREVRFVSIQRDGGTTASVKKGRAFVEELLAKRGKAPRCDFYLSDLRIGSNCGGSDAMSGLASNPAVGVMFDMVIEAGGTCFFDEITEMIGCGDMAATRSSNIVAEKIKEAIDRTIDIGVKLGTFGIATGNAEGGLTSIEEKSLGAYMKSGHKEIKDVIRVGERPQTPGLYLIDSIPDDISRGHSPISDAEDMSNAAAAGCHMLVFTTGRGTPMGSALMPVIKLCGSPKTCEVMSENIDIDTSDVIYRSTTIDEMGLEVLNEVIKVAQGKLTCAEKLGHTELHLHIMNQKHVPCEC